MRDGVLETSVPYTHLPGFSRTWQSVIARDADAASLYSRAPADLEACRNAVMENLARPRPWKTLTDILLEEGQRYGIPDTALGRLSLLAEGKAVVVVTGQQVGYLGGPFYTFLKAYHCTRLARALEASLKLPVLPVFWLEGEDHDLAEVSTSHYLNNPGEVAGVTFEPSTVIPNYEVGRYETAMQAAKHVHEMASLLQSVNAEGAELLEQAYTETDLSGGMGHLLAALFGDRELLIVEGMHPGLKQMARPLWQRVIESGRKLSDILTARSAELKSRGWPTPLTPTQDSYLFYLVGEDKIRTPIGYHGQLRHEGKEQEIIHPEQLLQRIESSEFTVSPKAALRPIYQDFVLPTIAYVAGPTELEYHAQLAPLYRELDVIPPSLFPRLTATVADRRTTRLIEKINLSVEQLLSQSEHELKRAILRDADEGETAKLFEQSREQIESTFEALKNELSKIDPTLSGAAENATGKALHPLKNLQQKTEKALKQKHSVALNRLEKILAELRPNGKSSERVLGTAHFLLKYGPHRLLEALDNTPADAVNHQFIEID